MAEKTDKKVTLKMVAEKAGVSASSVSLCLNGHPLAARLSAETRKRIFEVADLLSYTPSPLGRALKTGQSRLLALVIPQLSNGYFSFLAEHILTMAAKNSYQTLVCTETGFPRNLPDGIISCIPLPETYGMIPTVYIEPSGKDVQNILLHDIEKGMQKTAELFREKGHKKVWGVFDTANTKADIFVRVFQDNGLTPVLLPCCTSSREERKKTIRFLMEKQYPALVLNGHLTTANFLRHLEEKPLYQPVLASVCGYWNGELAHKALLCVTLTNIPLAAEKAVSLLLDEIKNKNKPNRKKQLLKVEAAFYNAEEFSTIPFTDPEQEQ